MKLREQLEQQSRSDDNIVRENSLKCLTLYIAIADLYEGHVWDSDWSAVAKLASNHKGQFYWKPTKIGELVLRGLHSYVSPLGDGYYDEEEEVGE